MSTPTAFALGFAFVVVSACVGSNPESGSPSSTTSSSSSSSSGDADVNGSCTGNTVDACGSSCTRCAAPTGGAATCTEGVCGLTCDSTRERCGDACVLLDSDSDNCGACAVSCGGGRCQARRCQPVLVASSPSVTSFDMDAETLYLGLGGDTLASCPLSAGCGANPPTILDSSRSGLRQIAVAGDRLVYLEGTTSTHVGACAKSGCSAGAFSYGTEAGEAPQSLDVLGGQVVWSTLGANGRIYACAGSACEGGVPTQVFAPAGGIGTSRFEPLAIDATAVFFATPYSTDPTSTFLVRRCELGAACDVNTSLISAEPEVTRLLRVGDLLYAATSSSTAPIRSEIWSMPSSSAANKTVLVRHDAGIRDFAVDTTHVFWTNQATGDVLRCRLTGCGPGPDVLASGQTGASQIRLAGDFVYWSRSDGVARIAKK